MTKAEEIKMNGQIKLSKAKDLIIENLKKELEDSNVKIRDSLVKVVEIKLIMGITLDKNEVQYMSEAMNR